MRLGKLAGLLLLTGLFVFVASRFWSGQSSSDVIARPTADGTLPAVVVGVESSVVRQPQSTAESSGAAVFPAAQQITEEPHESNAAVALRAQLAVLNKMVRPGVDVRALPLEYKAALEAVSSADPSLWPLIREFALHEAPYWLVRDTLLLLLAGQGDRESTTLLLAGLDDRDPRVRLYIAYSLSQIRDPSVADAALERLNRETDPRVKTALLDAAIALAPSSLTGRLWTLLRGDLDTSMRKRILVALARDSRSLGEVVDFLAKESDDAVIAAGIDAIASRKDTEALNYLLTYIAEHPESRGARAAIQRLAEMADPAVDEGLLSILKNTTVPEAQRSFLVALSTTRLPIGLEPLVWAFAKSSQSEDLRAHALGVLHKGTSPETSRFLAAVAMDQTESAKIRRYAVNSLVKRGDETSLDALRRLMLPGNPDELRQQAVVGLALNADIRSALTIRDFAVQDASPVVRASSTYIMGEVGYLLGADVVQDVLDKASNDPDPRVRDEARKALERAQHYDPANLRRLLEERFGKHANIDQMEEEVLAGKAAILGGPKK